MGIPIAFGGPHPGFFATTDKLKRSMPGRIIGISKDVHGEQAYRMAMQTREQHIRRDKATSNICTAQALLANMASFYMQWHGRHGLRKIAKKVRFMAHILMTQLDRLGYSIITHRENHFDTVAIDIKKSGFSSSDFVCAEFNKHEINIRRISDSQVSVSFDEITTLTDLDQLIEIFASLKTTNIMSSPGEFLTLEDYQNMTYKSLPASVVRNTPFMSEDQFSLKFSETNMMRYIHRLSDKDIGLAHSMVPLGSCTMKLNSAITMIPITWNGFSDIHPFVPRDQCQGYL